MKPLPCCLAVALLHLLPTVLAAGIPQIDQIDLSQHHHGPPLLSHLRDSMIAFFHRPNPAPSQKPILSLQDLLLQYDDQLVLRFSTAPPPDNDNDNAALADAAACLSLDLWAVGDNFVDIRLPSASIPQLLAHLPKRLAAAHDVLIADLAAAVHASYPDFGPDDSRMRAAKTDRPEPQLADIWRFNDNFFFRDFQPLDVIGRWMRLLEAMFPHVEYLTVGTSFEGRAIPALRVSSSRTHNDNDNGGEEQQQQQQQQQQPRKTIVVTGGIHAREWISTTTVNYLAWSYISSLGVDRIITKFLTHFDVVFVPVVNPDGFEYTWSVDRLWRKSRQSSEGTPCRGIDLDHAFAFGWNSSSQSQTQTQGEPCSGGYGGAAPFQAVEALGLADWARNETRRGVRIAGLLDLHSYSQQVLFPYSYSCDAEPPNLENLEELAAGLAKAIRLSNGESYSVTSACRSALSRLEGGGGSAMDWFYHELGAHFSYQIKLRDTGSYGFLVPKQYILPTGEEMLDAMKYYGDYLLGNNGIERVKSQHDASSSQEL